MLDPARAHAWVADKFSWLAFVNPRCADHVYHLLAGTEENQHSDNRKELIVAAQQGAHLVRVASFEYKAGDLPQSSGPA